ncbi:5-(carboxyamino)imidazole ribonucleotide synthase [Emticicia fluvialis]|uniref:5-(carboxyamino)imidazole ribonucleotide synthase n=1 Tax=Emticicia fluvialis TaxID=2974474 RepID=UPI0021652A19|nr:5-(carboxyamino)imidazole ribonucleotide synthase [Emticicia fluvialis]
MRFDNRKKLGILGGGQLGRMIIQAAIDFDFNIKTLDPDSDAPCKYLSHEFVNGSLNDYDTVMAFGQDCDILTIEIEAVSIEALEALQKQGKAVFPQPSVLRIIQDKRVQKQFYKDNNLPTADFILTENRADTAGHAAFLPAVHKLGKGGYDGKGVQVLRTEADLGKAFDQPGVLEKMIDFEKELAVIVARNENGETSTFPVVEMVFHPEANLVEYLFSPANVATEIEKKAQDIAIQTANALGIIGLLAVEMFLTRDGEILINEVAPRPHNSGHQTIRANDVSQFEQHLRAILNLPLGSTRAHSKAAMVNLLGEEGHNGEAIYEGMDDVLAIEGIHPFLYGKRFTKPFRKMGHITIVDQDFEKLKEKVIFVKEKLKVVAKN